MSIYIFFYRYTLELYRDAFTLLLVHFVVAISGRVIVRGCAARGHGVGSVMHGSGSSLLE